MSTKQFYITIYFRIALLFFFVSAVYGWMMRLQHVLTIPKFIYGHFLQAHSHVTFLGWGFIATISLVVYAFAPELIQRKKQRISFLIIIITLIGMLISFPVQGYKLFSILFLSIYLLTSYVIIWDVYKALRNDKDLPSLFIKTGIIYYYLSSIAIWAIPVISLKIGKGELYQNAIGFYTHFLYNGFFVFILFGLLFKYLDSSNVKLNKLLKQFYNYTNYAMFPVFFLVLYMNESYSNTVVLLALVGVILQLISLKFIISFLQKTSINNDFPKTLKWTSYVVFIAFVFKLIIQFLSAFPSLFNEALSFKSYFVIGYIHLFTLGFMSLFILILYQLFSKKELSKTGIFFFSVGVILSELTLFTEGTLSMYAISSLPFYNKLILFASTLMPLGIAFVLIKVLKK